VRDERGRPAFCLTVAKTPKILTTLPADLVRDLEWLHRHRPQIAAHFGPQVKSVLVKERDPKIRWRPGDSEPKPDQSG
jgi:hypothetical protein